jgi:hypothetical protein
MLQIEIYTNHIAEYTRLFQVGFGFELVENIPSFRKFITSPGTESELMLFDPSQNPEGENLHWDINTTQKQGVGIEIVLLVKHLAVVRENILKLGYTPSEIITKPWGTIEFDLILPEGYFIRVKQHINF